MKLSLALLSSLLLLCSCGQNSVLPVVHASAPSSISLDCSQGQANGQNDDGHGTLLIDWGPCTVNAVGSSPVNTNATMTYTLQNPINAHVLDAWIGTEQGSKIEVGYYFQIVTPDGRKGIFPNQLDKHQDVIGNAAPHQWNLPFNLPAGTQITVGVSVGVTNPETDCPCGIHGQWVFNQGFE